MTEHPKRRLLSGRVAVVTGASSGLGRATALALGGAGADVVCADLGPNRLADGFEPADSLPTHEAILDAGGRASFLRADVSSARDIEDLECHAVTEYGRIDIWVNNAGTVAASPIEVMSVDDFERLIAVDLIGTWLGCKSAARQMRKQDQIGLLAGHIVNLGSITASFGNANISAYSAVKGAVHSLTRALASELGSDGITVNAVVPGFFPTAMNRVFWDDPKMLSEIQSSDPLPQHGRPEDIANAIVFLASEEAAWITGVLLPVDGGFSAIGAFSSIADSLRDFGAPPPGPE